MPQRGKQEAIGLPVTSGKNLVVGYLIYLGRAKRLWSYLPWLDEVMTILILQGEVGG